MKNEKKCEICGDRAIWLSAGQNLFLALLKGFAGYTAGSVALLADAVHSGSDVLCAVFAAVCKRVSERPKDKAHPYGYGKVEYIVGLMIGVVLMVAAANILHNSLKILFFHEAIPTPGFLAFWVALLSVYSNFIVSTLTMCASGVLKSPVLKSVAMDNRSDAYSSMAVVVCILGSRLGFPGLDPLAAVFVGLLILKIGVGLVMENYHGLIDLSVPADQAEEMRKTIISVDEVKKISYLRTRQMGQEVCVDVEVCVKGEKTVDEAYSISREIRSALMRKIGHVSSVQVSLRPVT